MSQPPYSGPPSGDQPSSGQPYPGQPPYQGQPQPYPQQPYPGPGQQPYPGAGQQPYPDPGQQAYPGPGQQAYPGPGQQAYPGPGQQAYPGPGQQPYPGQPNPDVPTSVPPGYPPTQGFASAPDYTQPYAQPGYPAAGFPPPVPPKKSRTLPIVLTVVAIVLVLCVGGGTAVALVLRNQNDKSTSADGPTPATGTPTPDATDEPSEEPTKAAPAAKINLVEPKTLDGLPKLNYKQFDSTVKLVKTIISTYPGATGTIGAVYGRVGTKNALLMTATKARVTDPELTVDSVLASGGSTTKVTGVGAVSTGNLGGTAKCGNANNAGQKIAICAWADDGSIGVLWFYFKTTSQIKDDFPKVRAQLEKKS